MPYQDSALPTELFLDEWVFSEDDPKLLSFIHHGLNLDNESSLDVAVVTSTSVIL